MVDYLLTQDDCVGCEKAKHRLRKKIEMGDIRVVNVKSELGKRLVYQYDLDEVPYLIKEKEELWNAWKNTAIQKQLMDIYTARFVREIVRYFTKNRKMMKIKRCKCGAKIECDDTCPICCPECGEYL